MRRTLVAAVLLAFGGCRPATVDLAYRFDAGTVLSYLVTAHAAASWDIGGSAGSGSYRTSFAVREEIEEASPEDALVRVTMRPIEVEENGLPSPGTEERSFLVRAGPNGEVLEVLEVGGVPAVDLDPDELAFIGTYRPPLPLDRVGLRASWEAHQQVELGEVFQQVVTVGELEKLNIVDGAPAAHLHLEGGGPLVWSTSLPQGEAKLTGRSTTETDAVLNLDRGILQRATSETHGRFQVRAEGADGPVEGSLELTLRLELQPRAE